MKKLITLILAIAMVCSIFVGCNNDKADDNETTKAPETSKATEATTAKETEKETPKETEKETEKETPKETETEKETEPETTPDSNDVKLPEIADGVMAFYEDFDGIADATENEAVMKALGWKILNIEDGASSNSTVNYSIKDGQLGFENKNGVDSFMMIKDSRYMETACMNRNFTLQYDLMYTGGDGSRYAVLIPIFDGVLTYHSYHVRLYGTAHNQACIAGSWYTYDEPGDFYAPSWDDPSSGEGYGPSLLNKLYGETWSDQSSLANRSVTIKYQFNAKEGPTVWMRNNETLGNPFVCISKPTESSSAYPFVDLYEAFAFGMKVSKKNISGYIDNIAIWTGLGDMPQDTSTKTYEDVIADYVKAAK